MRPGGHVAPLIRSANEADAAALLALKAQLDQESTFMLWEPFERPSDVAMERHRITATNEGGGIILVSEADSRATAIIPDLVGFLSAERGFCRRTAHSVHLVLGVRAEYAGRGIATTLLAELENWGAAHGVHRLALTVRADNTRARALYMRNGYSEEGTLRDAITLRDCFVDEIAMAKLLPLPHRL